MKTANRWSAIWLSIVCAGALAQEPAANTPASPPPDSAPPSAPPSTAPQDAPPAQGTPSPADNVFIPSEEVQAAEELAFPVDI